MDNTQSQVIRNFQSLFGRYKASISENQRSIQIKVDNKTTEINKIRANQRQEQVTRI